MLWWTWVVPAIPLAGFLILAIFGAISRRLAAIIGAGSVGLSLAMAVLVGVDFMLHPLPGDAYETALCEWVQVGGLDVSYGVRVDALSLMFMLVITAVGFAIILYSTQFMRDSEGYNRFFAYMNLFVASMLILVLADSMLLLFLGWEGVGLCSYLLIGFWYADPANGGAARKAFIVTRAGDAAMAVGLLLLFTRLGTLHIQTMLHQAESVWPSGSGIATLAAFLILAGAVGKSAQLPLQTWLPDAMAGPTPVSALIHAATMVTAGVYLVARMHVLFALAPAAQTAVAWIGAATLLLAAFAAMTQRDIKRILAYSTISQIAYMFLALGVGAWAAGVYHFITHALFKSALFLGGGILIMCLDGEHDIFKMGGLRLKLPSTYFAMVMAALVLAAIPPLTLTFNSKDLILKQVLFSPTGGPVFWAIALFGALLTSFYTFRLIFVVFFGQLRRAPTKRPGLLMTIPLGVLALGGGMAGVIELLSEFFHNEKFYEFLQRSLPPVPLASAGSDSMTALTLQLVSVLVSMCGAGLAYWFYIHRPDHADRMASAWSVSRLHRFLRMGFGFDWAYDYLLVRPYCWGAKVNARDVVDWCMERPASLACVLNGILSRTETGLLRWYAMGVATGAIILIFLMVWL